MTDRMKLLDYLPPEDKQRVLLLVQRLQQETQSKNKYLALYNQTKQDYVLLNQKYGKLKDQNQYLKQQIHNSFSIVSQVRANFHATKNKYSDKKPKQEEDWSDESEQEQNEENKAIAANQSMTLNHPPRPTQKSSLQKFRPLMTSTKKEGSVLNISNNFLNTTNLSGSKSKQVEQLRRQVRALQQQKKKKQYKDKQFKEKSKLVDQIKKRYKGQNSEQGNDEPIQSIDITDTFQGDQPQVKTKKASQNINRVKSSQKIQKKQYRNNEVQILSSSREKPANYKQLIKQQPKLMIKPLLSVGKKTVEINTAQDDDIFDLLNP